MYLSAEYVSFLASAIATRLVFVTHREKEILAMTGGVRPIGPTRIRAWTEAIFEVIGRI